MQAGVLWRGGEGRAQDRFALLVAAALAKKIGEIDGRGGELGHDLERRLILGLRLRRLARAGIKASQRQMRLGAVGVELLRREEIAERTLISLLVGGRHAR